LDVDGQSGEVRDKVDVYALGPLRNDGHVILHEFDERSDEGVKVDIYLLFDLWCRGGSSRSSRPHVHQRGLEWIASFQWLVLGVRNRHQQLSIEHRSLVFWEELVDGVTDDTWDGPVKPREEHLARLWELKILINWFLEGSEVPIRAIQLDPGNLKLHDAGTTLTSDHEFLGFCHGGLEDPPDETILLYQHEVMSGHGSRENSRNSKSSLHIHGDQKGEKKRRKREGVEGRKEKEKSVGRERIKKKK